jgi:hypothetical protein
MKARQEWQQVFSHDFDRTSRPRCNASEKICKILARGRESPADPLALEFTIPDLTPIGL